MIYLYIIKASCTTTLNKIFSCFGCIKSTFESNYRIECMVFCLKSFIKLIYYKYKQVFSLAVTAKAEILLNSC